MKLNIPLIKKSLKEKPGAAITVIAFLFLLGTYLFSKHQDTKVITYKNNETNFNSGRVISRNNEIYKRKDKVFTDKIHSLEEKLVEISSKLASLGERQNNASDSKDDPNPISKAEVKEPKPLATPKFSKPPRDFQSTVVSGPKEKSPTLTTARKKRTSRRGPSIISFPVQSRNKPPELGVNLPSGSFVKAKLLTGIEAPEGKALPVLLQADFAFIGPNKSKVDLSGCFLIAKSTGNMSIERVEMQATKISCVSRSGKSFERPLNGYIADGKDNSFAVMGEVNSKQDRVAAMAFLSSVVEGIGGAVSQAQTSSFRNQNGSSSTMVTGSQKKFIAASGASNAAATITNWYLKHAEQLLPTINVGSGQEVWIIIQESVELPNWYFKRQFSNPHNVSFLSNILK